MIKLKQFVLLIIMLISWHINAQDLVKDANANFKGFNFQLALEQYLSLLETDSINPEYNYRTGVCYLNLNLDKSKALKYVQFAVNNGFNKPEEIFDLALAYFFHMDFAKAIKKFKEYLVMDTKNNDLANLYIRYAKNAENFTSNPRDISFVNLGEYVNSEKADYNTYLNTFENILYYTSNRKYNSEFKTYIKDIYYTELDGNVWQRARAMGSTINSMDDEIISGIGYNNDYLFFRLQRYDVYDDIYYTFIDGKRTKGLEPIGENINSKSVESGAALSMNGDTLLFATDIGGYGGLDIYMSNRLPDGTWGPPQNLGENINTSQDEDFPVFQKDGREIIFSSKGHNSMGGFDLFRSEKLSGVWQKPVNLGYPINTVYDDNTIAFSIDKRYAYKADVRVGGIGDYDIYQLIFNDVEPVYTIFRGFVNVEQADSNVKISNFATELYLNIYHSGKSKLVGKFAVNSENSSYIVALAPGKYDVEIQSDIFKKEKKEFIVPEMNTSNIIIKRNLIFSLK